MIVMNLMWQIELEHMKAAIPDFGVGDFPALLEKRRADVRYLTRLRSMAATSETVSS